MPSLDKPGPLYESCKAMLYGDSGTGKTGSVAALANIGYQIRILDFDRGLDPLASFVKPEFKRNVHYITCTDRMVAVPGGKSVPKGVPTAWTKATNALNRWKDGDVDYGPIESWDNRVVLVWDSLTFSGDAAMRLVLARAGRSGETPYHLDYGEAMEMQERALTQLYAENVKCHVLVMAHFRFLEDPTAPQRYDDKGNLLPRPERAYPSALGKKLPPKIGRFFNTMLMTKVQGNRRIISSTPEENVMVKSPVPLPATMPIETGLATLFEKMGFSPPKE